MGYALGNLVEEIKRTAPSRKYFNFNQYLGIQSVDKEEVNMNLEKRGEEIYTNQKNLYYNTTVEVNVIVFIIAEILTYT